MPTTLPDAAYIEIVEKKKDPNEQGAAGIIVPTEVRINGVPLLCPDEPIIVHEVSTDARDPVKVTLTLFARRVEFKSEVQS